MTYLNDNDISTIINVLIKGDYDEVVLSRTRQRVLAAGNISKNGKIEPMKWFSLPFVKEELDKGSHAVDVMHRNDFYYFYTKRRYTVYFYENSYRYINRNTRTQEEFFSNVSREIKRLALKEKYCDFPYKIGDEAVLIHGKFRFPINKKYYDRGKKKR